MHLGEKKRLWKRLLWSHFKRHLLDRDAPDTFKKTGLSLYSLVSPLS